MTGDFEAVRTSRYTIGAKLGVAFAVMLAATAALAMTSLMSIHGLGRVFPQSPDVEFMKRGLAESIATDTAKMTSLEAEILLHVHMNEMAAAERYETSFGEESAKAMGELERIRPLLTTELEIREVDALTREVAAAIAGHAEEWRLARGRHLKEADKIFAGPILLAGAEMQRPAANLVQMERDRIAQGIESGRSRIFRERWMTLILVCLFAIVSALAVWVLRVSLAELRRITCKLDEGRTQISSAALQMASSSHALSEGASEQAASLEETSASLEEITSMTRKNAANSRAAAEVMTAVDGNVKEGNRTLEQMMASMEEINASSGKISKIIKVIDEIAFQTNILALNAAVEAARAGEAGMGFAVVADEVRNLAQRSAQAARDTTGLIEESIQRSGEGRGKLKQVIEVIRAITQNAAKVKTLVDEVNAGSQDQASGIEEISKAVTHMNGVTHTTALSADEGNAAAMDLTSHAETMSALVGGLHAMISRGHVDRTLGTGARAKDFGKRAAGVGSVKALAAPRFKFSRSIPASRTARETIPLEDSFTEIR